jgi:phosphatidylglycerol:prolipoprotein diacylglycerol transferase
MTNYIIEFPGLGLTLNPPAGFSIGSFEIRFYGLVIALGLILAVVYALKRREQFGISEDDLLDGVLWIAPFAILCARLYYCAFEWERYADNPISILYIWEGGIAIYGAVIGAALGVFIHCKFIKKISVFAVLDLVSLGFMIGQMLGRWGNFFNREAHGGVTDSFLRMGLINPYTGTGEYYHPTFLYESLWNLVGFILIHFLSKKRKYDGQVALMYVAWYGLGRAFIEGLRTDSLMWGDFRVSQILAGATAIAAAVTLFVLSTRKHDPEKLFVNQVAAAEEKTEE